MPAEAFAVLAAIAYAATQVLIKLGTRDTSAVAGLLVSLGAGTVVSVLAYLMWGQESLHLNRIAPFVVAGIFGAALGRILTIVAVDRLGPSVSVPLQGSVYPLSAVLIGIVFLDETTPGTRLGGVGFLLVGVWLLSRVEPNTRALTSRAKLSKRPKGRLLRPGVIFPLLAGLCYGAADYFRKRGIAILPDPIMGTAIGVSTSFTFWLTVALLVKPLRAKLRFGRGARFFALSGLTGAAAVLSVIHAFETGDVSAISPIVASQPLPTLIFSAIFLRGIERITPTIVLGAASAVVGVILISI
jgi:DME family drug/metabolite transporter